MNPVSALWHSRRSSAILCPARDEQQIASNVIANRHSRLRGNPVSSRIRVTSRLDSRLRGNDGESLSLSHDRKHYGAQLNISRPRGFPMHRDYIPTAARFGSHYAAVR